MTHFTCRACVARVWLDDDLTGQAADGCPGCGGPLDAVTRAEDLIGLRALKRRPRGGRSIGDQVREAIARNDAARTKRLQLRNTDEQPHDA